MEVIQTQNINTINTPDEEKFYKEKVETYKKEAKTSNMIAAFTGTIVGASSAALVVSVTEPFETAAIKAGFVVFAGVALSLSVTATAYNLLNAVGLKHRADDLQLQIDLYNARENNFNGRKMGGH